MERFWSELVDLPTVKNGQLVELAKATAEWREEKGFETNWRNFAEKLMLVMTEVSEAADAAHNASDVLSMLLAPRNVGEIGGYARSLSAHAENYVEEWIDVMVRVLDIAGSCDIPVYVEKSPEKRDEPLALAEVFERRADLHVIEALRQGTGAMEVFRDITLMCCDDNGAVKPEQENKRHALTKWLSGILSTAVWAIQGIGENWRENYARKMIRNEQRPARHGRQR